MLSLTEILEYSLYREGQFLIPISAFKYDMNKLETLFYNVVRQEEKYVPRSEAEFMHVTLEGIYLPDVYAVKSLGYTGYNQQELISSIPRPINPRYWTWDRNSHILQAQVDSNYLVKCLKYYTFEKLHYVEELGMPLRDQDEFTGKLIAEPDVNSLRFKSGNRVSVFESLENCDGSTEVAICNGSLGTVAYNTETRMATLMLDDCVCEPIQCEYLTKYRGFRELDISTSTLLVDSFAAELFCGIGSLELTTQLEQSPVKWSAPNLLEYGRNLRQSILDRRSSQMNFYEWLP